MLWFEDLILKEPGSVGCLPVRIGLSIVLTWNLSVSIFSCCMVDSDAGLLHVCWFRPQSQILLALHTYMEVCLDMFGAS